MAEFIDLDRLLAIGRVRGAVVAWRAGVAHDFAAFAARVADWAAAFANIDGVRVALYFDDSAEFAAALFGAWHAGKEAVLPADALPGTWHRLLGLVSASASDAGVVQGLPRVQPTASAPAPAVWPELDPQRIAVHVFTSGSTGVPELIPKRLAQLAAEVRALEDCFATRIGRGCVHASVSHQHMYGLPFLVLWPLASGRAFSSRRLGFPEDIRHALAITPDAVLVTSPAHLKRLPEQLDWTPVRARLAAVFSSGGPLAGDALALCGRALGQVPIEVYGSSETGAVAWRQREDGRDTHWQPLPGMTVRIAGECLQMAAPWLQDSGWQDSADRAVADGAGFALRGRADRIVKIEEKRVSLDAFERELVSTGLLLDARAVVLAGGRSRIGIVAIPNAAGWALHDADGRRAFSQRLRAVLATSAEAVVLPRRWRFSWALPLNATGKTTTAALLALFDPRRPHARLLEHTDAVARLQIEVAEASPYFDGHFVAAPILPGVAQIDWAILFARELFAMPTQFAGLEAIKFHDWIGAGASVTLSLQRSADDVVAFRIGSDKGAHASGRILFRDPQ